MSTKNVLRISLLFICCCHVFLTKANIHDRGYILILNSYAESDVWANHAIDSIRKDHSIKEDIWVESLNMLLEDSVTGLQKRRDYILAKYDTAPRCVVMLGNSIWCVFEDVFKEIWKDVPVILCVREDYVGPLDVMLKREEINPKDIIPLQDKLNGLNVTLIECPVYIRETIDEMKRLLPNMKKIVLISDRHYVSAQIREKMRHVCETYFPDLDVSYFIEGQINMDQMLDSIYSYDMNEVGLLYFSWVQRKEIAGNKYLSTNNHKAISYFDNHPVFTLEDNGIHDGDKIGIIGINGTGKSTLLKIIAGEEETDEGQVISQNGLRITYLPQMPDFPKGAIVQDYVADGKWQKDWSTESEARNILNKLGITEHDVPVEQLSGGQKKRVALARTLVNPSDVLILDEPTNHLDNEMVTWLEDYLNRFKGVVIMVTHDRYFLDKVTNKILEISHGKVYSYDANYSGFLELKAQREEMELASERKRQSILRMELEWAKRGCRARSTKQRARLERLEALKNGKAPVQETDVQMDSVETRMGKKTVELHHISKSYGDKVILDDFDYIVLRNQRLGIIGPNGCGKSTLIRIIDGMVEPDSGTVEIGETIKIGYFAQEVPDMNGNQRVIDYIRDVAEFIPTRDGKISASMMLERFLFDSAMQYTPVAKLSGGEKRRLYLLKVLMEAPNVLLLDEPSNDLDIPTLTILEDYLSTFSGIVITVSHDRYFLDDVVDRIFAFEGNGKLTQYEGGYTDYAEAKARKYGAGSSEIGAGTGSSLSDKAASGNNSTEDEEKKPTRKDWKQGQKSEKLKFTYKEEREYAVIDEDIARLEEKIARLENDMMANATNSVKLSELMKEKEETETTLEEKMDRWVYLNDLAEQIENQ